MHATLRLIALLLSLWLPLQPASAEDDFGLPMAQQQAVEPFDPSDPYEDFNRRMFRFNLELHNTIGQPLVDAWHALPSPLRTGLHNVVTNLTVPWTVINDLLQGNVGKFTTDTMRFGLNTVLGLGGLLDIASEAGMDYQQEDMGQTFFVWGVWRQSAYLVLPVLGPYTTRELVGRSAGLVYDPVYDTLLNADAYGRLGTRAVEIFIDYTDIAPLLVEVQQQPDPYIFAREAYLQSRLSALYDGHPPQPDIDDIDLD